jgi:hypothetical protein
MTVIWIISYTDNILQKISHLSPDLDQWPDPKIQPCKAVFRIRDVLINLYGSGSGSAPLDSRSGSEQ